MAKDINLTSQEWCDIVFEGKNQEYGAYKIRRGSSNRSVIALVIILGVVILVACLPTLIETVKAAVRPPADGLTETAHLANLQKMEEIPEENLATKQEAPPPPPLKSTIKFTPPEMVSHDEMSPDDGMQSQDQLQDTKVQISVADVQGTDDIHGIDIADLKEHKVIVEAKEVIHEIVDKEPQFPGGESAMMDFIRKSLVYPPAAVEYHIQGTVNVRFVVNSSGKVSFDRVLGKADKYLQDEAVRVVKTMPNWIPGERDGKKVSSYFIIPIRFVLD